MGSASGPLHKGPTLLLLLCLGHQRWFGAQIIKKRPPPPGPGPGPGISLGLTGSAFIEQADSDQYSAGRARRALADCLGRAHLLKCSLASNFSLRLQRSQLKRPERSELLPIQAWRPPRPLRQPMQTATCPQLSNSHLASWLNQFATVLWSRPSPIIGTRPRLGRCADTIRSGLSEGTCNQDSESHPFEPTGGAPLVCGP